MIQKLASSVAVLLLTFNSAAAADYGDWKHHGTLAILTTPEGANLRPAAVERDFPILVRLNKELFEFSQAKPDGADIRFSADDKPLAYQIESWDVARGVAAIWVRMPAIRGNERQEIAMHWGNEHAASESNAAAVFNASNGFLTVMHMNDPAGTVTDAVGTLSPHDTGTTPTAGLIGPARHFETGKGICGGETIAVYPFGARPHSTEAWFRAEQPNATVVGWGNEHGQGKVIMDFASPPHIRMDCYFSGANVSSERRLTKDEWIHVAHTFAEGDSRLYINGRLEGRSTNRGSPLAIASPARMYVGGWYGNYRFVGDIDEVRISSVTRSADWIKLEYENQKPLETLVGMLVQEHNAVASDPFAILRKELTVDEGKSETIHLKAPGADKIYWRLDRDGHENIVAADTLAYTFNAGRVLRDTACKITCKAVYPLEEKRIEIPVTVKNTIPEPDFTLESPATWNGRDKIEVVPTIHNLAAMKGAGAADLHYHWEVSGGAVIRQIAVERLILKRSQYTGPITVAASIDNGGTPTVVSAKIEVTEPTIDPWIVRVPEKDEKPEEGQFYARDDKNEGTLYYNGTLDGAADAVFLKVFVDDVLFKSETHPRSADKAYAFTVKLKPGLVKYRMEFGMVNGGVETVRDKVGDLVCGDAFLIQGQSNALATDTGEESPRETHEWIRSYGQPTGDQNGRQNLWCRPVWKERPGDKAELGYWGMELAKRLVVHQKMPIFILNGAVGGTRIDQHQRSEINPADVNSIYGRTLWRLQHARLTHGIRAVIWHQGESDQGADGPTGGFGWETYQRYFVDMAAGWKEDYPNIQHYYVFQIWPDACSMGGPQGSGDRLREAQRTLPRLFSNMDIMSTLGIRPPGGCHYPLVGWAEFARLLEPLIARDFYGKRPSVSISPPNLRRAYYTGDYEDEIVLEFDQPVVWLKGLESQFYLDDQPGQVAGGSASKNTIRLKLKDQSSAKKLTYLKEKSWSQEKLIYGANGIAALTFCDVEIGVDK